MCTQTKGQSMSAITRPRAPYVPMVEGVKTCPVCGERFEDAFDGKGERIGSSYVEHYMAAHAESTNALEAQIERPS